MTVIDHQNYQNQRSSIRPSLRELQNDDFMEQLSAESEKLRRSNPLLCAQPFSGRPVSSTLQASPRSSDSKPKSVKKSRFAMEREAELEASRQEAVVDKSTRLDEPVPIGRFELNLSDDEEKDKSTTALPNGQIHPIEPKCFTENSSTSLLGDILERDILLTVKPNNDFTSNYEPSGFPSANPSTQLPINGFRSSPPKPEAFSRNQMTLGLMTHSTSSATKFTDSEFSIETKRQISVENDLVLARMSESEILDAQAEIKAMMIKSNSALLDKLLSEADKPSDFDDQLVNKDSITLVDSHEISPVQKKTTKRVQFLEDVAITSNTTTSCCPESADERPRSSTSGTTSNPPAPPFASAKLASSHQVNQHLAGGHELKFDFTGPAVRVIAGNVPQSAFIGVHSEQTQGFTLNKLFGLIMSSVPSQRVLGFKFMSQIADRYLVTQSRYEHDKELVMSTDTVLLPAIPHMILAASHGLAEKNLGVADSALRLFHSVSCGLLEMKNHGYKFSPDSTFEWVDELFTHVNILAKIQSHFQFQILPKLSLALMIRSLCAVTQLGQVTRIAEEITKQPMFLEQVVQVLVSVPWPPATDTKIELPNLDCLHLLQMLSQSSRQCCQSLVDRGLLTPTFRFLALPYWTFEFFENDCTHESKTSFGPDSALTMTRFMSQQFQIISDFAAYGLGTSLRTTLDPLLRPIASQLQTRLTAALDQRKVDAGQVNNQSIADFKFIAAYLHMLRSWMQCANDPHVTDPPHSINWSQVIEWSSDGVEFLSLCLRATDSPDGISDDCLTESSNSVLAFACDLLEQHFSGCFKKNIDTSLIVARLSQFQLQLQARLEQASRRILSNATDKAYLTPSNQCLEDAHLVTSMSRLSSTMCRTSSVGRPLMWLPEKSFCPTDEELARVCQLAFKHYELSTLPTSLCTLYMQPNTRMLVWACAASLFLRNSDGDMLLSSITTFLELHEQTLNASESDGLNDRQLDGLTSEGLCASDVNLLRPLYQTYIDECAAFTSVSYPTPQQIRKLMRRNEQPAFVLSSTWPLLAITFLTKSYVRSLLNDLNPTKTEVLARLLRASLGLAIKAQTILGHLQTQASSLPLSCKNVMVDGKSSWKALLITVIVSSSQSDWEIDENDSDERGTGSIFEDAMTCRLVAIFMSPFQSYSRPSITAGPPPEPKVYTNHEDPLRKEDEMELYSILTDILGIYDSSSFANSTFSMLLVPFFDMTFPIDFRRLLFRDYAHILAHLKVSLTDVIILDSDAPDIRPYLYPLETNEDMIILFAQMLGPKSLVKSDEHAFLYFYIVHHVSSFVWNLVDLTETKSKIKVQLIKTVLSQCDDEACLDVLKYQQIDCSKEHESLIRPPLCYQLSEADVISNRRQWINSVLDFDLIEKFNKICR